MSVAKHMKLLGFAVAGTVLAFTATPALAVCSALSDSYAAFEADDVEAGRAALAAAESHDDCFAEDVAMAQRMIGVIQFNAIADQVVAGAPLEDFADELDAIRKQGAPWQVYDALGDIAKGRKDFTSAGEFYLIALEEASDPARTPDFIAPDEAYILHLDKAATEMRLAADTPPRLSIRGGCKVNFRGVKIQKKTTPIRFEFDDTAFTEQGLVAADELLTCLKTADADEITLIGHTDPSGPDYYNLDLSLRRAQATADYLYDHGFAGHIEVEGKGETELFQPDDPTAYTQDQLFQMHRRVDVIMK